MCRIVENTQTFDNSAVYLVDGDSLKSHKILHDRMYYYTEVKLRAMIFKL